MSEVFQLHQTGLAQLSRCGIAFENRNIKRMRETRSTSLIVGSAVDRSVSADLTEKKDFDRLLPNDHIQDVARDATLDEWKRGEVQLNEEDRDDGWSPDRDAAVDAAVDLALFHHKMAAPAIKPTAVQRKFTLDVHGVAIPLQLVGQIDIEEADSIRDTKTSAKSPKKSAADESLQLTTYSLAKLQIDGALTSKVALDYVVRTPKRADLKLIQLESKRTLTDLTPLMHRITVAAKIIQSGLFTPADPGSWWCSKKFCSYFETCPYAVHPISVAINGEKV